MAHGKLYRSFIILQESEKGHSIASDKPLSGYAKIEAKNERCKIAFYVQNLKKDYNQCYMILICNKKDGKYNLNIGPMNINPQGKAEMSIEYDGNNIGDYGVSYDKVIGAALGKDMNGKMVYLMCGFLNGEQPKDNWKNYKMVEGEKASEKKSSSSNEKSKDNTEEKMPSKEDKKSQEKKYEYKKENKHQHEMKEDHSKKYDNDKENEMKYEHEKKHDYEYEKECDDKYEMNGKKSDSKPDMRGYSYDSDIEYEEDSDEEHEYIKRREYEEYNSIESKFDDYEREIEMTRNSEENLDEDDFELRGSMGDFFAGIISEFESVRGFSKDIKNCKWYKVKVDNFDEMCNISNYNKYTVIYYPMINYFPYICKYGYFNVGLKCDKNGVVKYVVYAIPGTKDKKDQPYGGRTGFVTWVPGNTGSGHGHWLMFYDFQNSMVVVPMK